ncbi:MAG: secretin and TonB N-terminal domain-containing protein [bacterium]
MKKVTIILLFIIMLCWWASCARMGKKVDIPPPDAATLSLDEIPLLGIKKSAQKNPEQKSTSPVIDTLELEEMPLLTLKKKAYIPEKHYTINIRNADLRSLLLSFTKESTYNIVVDSNVEGNVTVDLKEVTLNEALDLILTPLGYRYRQTNNIIKIFKPERETRIFPLSYLITSRQGQTIVEAKTPGSVSGMQTGTTKVINTENIDLWAEIENSLKGLLSPEGTYFVNKMASTIVVKDYLEYIEKVAEYLEILEGTIQRQVLIEAMVIEVILSDNYEMGINWTHISGTQGGSTSTQLIQNTTNRVSSSIFKFSYQSSDLEALLNAISEEGRVNIISKPRITSLNNQKAIIKVGTEEVYFERETEEDINKGTEITTYASKFFTVGFVLDVTPQISATGEITLHIHPILSEKVDEKAYPNGDGTIPIVSIRESSSVVKIRSGQTLVLGGLMQEKDTEKVIGIPILMNIPLIGHLFRYTKKENQKTELVVAITPKILYGKKIEELDEENLDNIFGPDLEVSL